MAEILDRLTQALADRYAIEGEIGAGGMATVWRARDLRHRRPVAIKVLRPDLAETLGADRFAREIEIAAGLTHPHILPLHDSGNADGLLYYVMPYIEGESLRDRLAREGALPVPEAVRIFREIADALSAAHARGVVHRDIKPANVLISGGHALVADFGVARAVSEAGERGKLTTTGAAIGTPQYMSPEQASADPATDHRADIFAAGIIAYEMLTGTSPFEAPTTPAVFAALMTRTPAHPTRVRSAVPEPLGDLVLWCMEKEPSARPQSAAELLHRLDTITTPVTGVTAAGGAVAPRGRPRMTPARIAAVVALVAVGLFWAWRINGRRAQVEWARQVAVPEVLRLVGENQLREAAELAAEAERILGEDPILEPLWPRMTAPFHVVTDPPGAEVSYRPYEDPDAPWVSLGRTPYRNERFKMGAFRFRIELAGHEPVEQVRSFIPAEMHEVFKATEIDYLTDPSYVIDVTLAPLGRGEPGMLEVPGGQYMAVPVAGFGVIDPVEMPRFLIDRTEVTNAAYLEFVTAGAYSDSTFWTEPFLRAGARVPWRVAMADLVDATARPGPATWVLGRPPEGREAFPVGGVNWYEATAYCRWGGKSLPTLFHWARAAIPSSDSWIPFHMVLAAASNLESDGPVAVGSRDAIGVSGAQDLAGNVREWLSTPSGENRHFAGGAWNDPQYAIRDRVIASPWVRLPTDGFRCASYPDGPLPAQLLRSVDLPRQRLSGFTALPDAVFQPTRSVYAYDRSQPLAARVDSTSTSPSGAKIEWVSVDAAYGGRLPMRLHIPANAEPPYGAVIFFPGSNLLSAREITPEPQLPFLPQAGRVLVEPIYDGGFNRNDGRTQQRLQTQASRTTLFSHWVQDLGRAIDYLEQRPDVDASTVAYAGLSLGAGLAPLLLPYEPRFRAAILLSGGLSMGADQATLDYRAGLAGRLRLPLLMLGGRNDFANLITHQEALFRAFGTPDDQKRFRVYDAAHWPLPMNEVIREVVDFLDRYAKPGAGSR